MKENRALIVVDMLYDFIDGSLACQEAEKAISATLAYIEQKHPYPILLSGTIIPLTTAPSQSRAVPGRRIASRAPTGPIFMRLSSPT